MAKAGTFIPGWSNLPGGLVFLILDELPELIDFLRFAVACKVWYSFAKHYYHTMNRGRLNKVLPMLLIPSELIEVDNTTTKGKILLSSLYSISGRRIYINNLESPVLPYGTNRLVNISCSHGWLATLDQPRRTIALVNPFQKSVAPILLPPLKTNPKKVVLSADPALDRNACVVAAMYTPYLAFMKLSEGKDQEEQPWTYTNKYIFPSDVIFYKSHLYVSYSGGSIIGDVNHKRESYAPLPVNEFTSELCALNSYILESTTGDLWHVRR